VSAPTSGEATGLRAEHDALAARLAVRVSVDQVQVGGVLTFFGVIAFGLTCKFAWDRWGWLPVNKPPPPPGIALWVLSAGLLTVVLGALAVRRFRQARRLRDQEAVLFERLRQLRRRLELDT
jgi:hypothetical protein